MDDTSTPITHAALAEDPRLSDWRVLLGRLQTRFATGDFLTGSQLLGRIAQLAEEQGHHPDVDVRFGHVDVTTVSHDVGALTSRDVTLAVAVSDTARELGVAAQPDQVSALEIALDALDHDAVRPFWAAVLGYAEDAEHDEVSDRASRLPALWFQEMDPPRHERNRFHLDITVPHDVAEQRVTAALAAGGRLVSEDSAPSFWVLADAEGNEVCVCTWQGRA